MKNNYTTINKAVVIFLLTSLMGIGISIAQNNPPIAEDDTINYTAPITTIFESVLIANDNDPDGDPLAWDTLINVTGNGTVNWLSSSAPVFTINYNLQWHPDSVFSGIDTLLYVVCDNGTPSLCDTAYIFIIVPYDTTTFPYYSFLNINNIKARFNVSGSDFWDFSTATPSFEAPKGSGKHSMFTSGLWIGGKDSNDSLHIAAVRYLSSGNDYYSGPIMDSSSYSAYEDSIWNKMWKISKAEVDNHNANWNQPGYTAPSDFISWPAHGDLAKGQATNLAPYHDNNNDGNYDPYDGDYPLIKGDQCIYFLRNDDRGVHNETGGAKLGIEIHGMAYAFDCPSDSALYNTIFVNYRIINRSSNIYDSTVIGFNFDPDIGSSQDDYVGSDVTRSTAFAYNGPAIDGTGAVSHYGEHPPAQGITILKGPLMDADGLDNPIGGCDNSINGLGFGDGILDNERFGMTNFAFYCNPGIGGCNGSTQGDPATAVDYYSYLRGYWKDGTRMVYGGNGHFSNCTSCENANFMFPGVSDPCNWGTGGITTALWDENSAGNQANDRRGIASAGSFTFDAGDIVELEVAYVFGRDYVDSLNPWSSVVVMNERIDSIISYFGNDLSPCGNFTLDLAEESEMESSITIFPNPAKDMLTIKSGKSLKNVQYGIYDLLGKTIKKGYLPISGKLNIYELPKGIFILKVEDSMHSYHQKFIKM